MHSSIKIFLPVCGGQALISDACCPSDSLGVGWHLSELCLHFRQSIHTPPGWTSLYLVWYTVSSVRRLAGPPTIVNATTSPKAATMAEIATPSSAACCRLGAT